MYGANDYRYFLFQAGLIPIICLVTEPTHQNAQSWLNDILTTKDLLTQAAANNRLASRCLNVFERLCAPVFNVSEPQEVLQNPEVFDGTFSAYTNDQLNGMDFWDWSNTMVNWPS